MRHTDRTRRWVAGRQQFVTRRASRGGTVHARKNLSEVSGPFVVFINQVGPDAEVYDIGGKGEIRRWPDAVVEYGSDYVFRNADAIWGGGSVSTVNGVQIIARLEGLWAVTPERKSW